MVVITCDVCGAKLPDVLRAGEEWILGYDLQVESPSSVHRSIRFLPQWDSTRVMELGAIHLCSLECRDRYLEKSKAA